ncbi:MAG TPA: ABC transporter ATP-binding protein, partial [Myxococcota bacterium]
AASKEYGTALKTVALKPTSLAIHAGELIVILGPSGSGKTTLLNLLGGLDRPTSGDVVVGGQSLAHLSERALGEVRRARIGFVFQFFNLVSTLTAAENVALAAEIAGVACDADALLAQVGLPGLGNRFPSELSGGQQQRVAIARALAKRPAVLLCDEPTGALDQEAGAQVLDLLDAQRKQNHCTTLIVTHDPTIAARADRVIRIRDGSVVAVDNGGAP